MCHNNETVKVMNFDISFIVAATEFWHNSEFILNSHVNLYSSSWCILVLILRGDKEQSDFSFKPPCRGYLVVFESDCFDCYWVSKYHVLPPMV